MSWEIKRLDEVCSLITDGKHGDCQNQPGSGYYFISAKDIIDWSIKYENARQITKEDFDDTHRRTQLEPFDVTMVSTGASIGRVAIAKDEEVTYRTTFQKSVAILKPIPGSINPFYLAYFLKNSNREIHATSSGSAQKNVLLKDLRAFKIPIPPLPAQRRIATILSAYDGLIENNLKRIRLLEEAAQNIYREWFVHFRFPGHERAEFGEDACPLNGRGVPMGWRKGKVEDLIILQRGFDLPSRKRVPGEYPIVASTGIIGYHSEFKVDSPGVVTGRSGSIGRVSFVDKNFWPLNTSLWVKSYFQCGPHFVYFFLKGLALENLSGGAAVPSLDRNVVHAQQCLIPSKEIIDKFETFAGFIFHEMSNLQKQNDLLKEARDILLPRLMNRTIEV